jgi:hypothetical protein
MRLLKDHELNAVAGGWDPDADGDPFNIDFDLIWDNGIGVGYSDSASFGFDFGEGKKVPAAPKPKNSGESDAEWLKRIVEEAMQKLKIVGSVELSLEKKDADGSSISAKAKVDVHNN